MACRFYRHATGQRQSGLNRVKASVFRRWPESLGLYPKSKPPVITGGFDLRGDVLKYGMDARAEAVRLFDMGFADKLVGRLLGIPHDTVRGWLYAYRALGREALFVSKHRTYSHDLKVEAAKAVIEGRMTKPEAMESYGLKSKTQIDTWCRLYREGGPDALLPKPKGRPKKAEPVFSSREEELEARVRELELELEIQKRINALAEGIERKRRTR